MWVKGINQWVFAPETPESRLWEFRTQAREAGIALPSVSTALYWSHPVTDNSPQVRVTALDIKSLLRQCWAPR